jgi:hypothetical protein
VVAAIVLALGLCLVIDPLIRLLLPKYVDAIPVICILATQLPISAAGLPLLIIPAALWYKSVTVLTLTRVLVCLTAVFILPKSLSMIAAAMILGELSTVIVGFSILQWNSRKQ